MRLFWEVARRAFRRYSTYRAATFGGVFTNTVFGFIRASVFVAVYRGRDDIGGFDLTDALTFTFVSQGFLAVVGTFMGHLVLAERIQTGDVVTDLYRPVDLQLFELSEDVGRAAYQCTIRAMLPVIAGGLVFDLRLPTRPGPWLVFLVATFLGLVVSFAMRFLVSLSTFWTLDHRAASQISVVLGLFLSGFTIPIVFFPDWLADLARVLPWAAFVQVPIEVLLGKHAGWGLVAALAGQAAWAAALLGAGRLVLAAATRRVVVQGG
ncbi:MAG TPA: ABC-2 family transporter protein [Acidimicrobiales bacterium]|nr:ABC-2 family transporter protein [Acidimicrobiales bacterium]